MSSSVVRTKPKAAGRTLSDFKAAFDPDVRIPAQIRAGLKSLLAEGPEAWEYEADFLRRCGQGVGNTHISRYRPQFEKHIVVVRIKGKNDKNVWFADVKAATKARG